jgi:DtxR family Mn-dependent transcriptional regulator
MDASSLSASLEDYLEAIFCVSRLHGVARAKDIAEKANVGKSSVTAALKLLSEKGLINYDPYQYISLTEKGETEAQKILRRHEVLKEFLVEILHVEDDLAGKNACRMEHQIDEHVLDKLIEFVDKFRKERL